MSPVAGEGATGSGTAPAKDAAPAKDSAKAPTKAPVKGAAKAADKAPAKVAAKAPATAASSRAAAKGSAKGSAKAPAKAPAKTASSRTASSRKAPAKAASAPAPSAKLKAEAREVYEILHQTYPDADCALVHANAFELLVATVLSAQSTDAGVNKVTPELFRRWPTPEALSVANLSEVEEVIHSTGFFRAKAANIVALSAALVENFGGEVPESLDQLTTLPGVGRKTAHVVRGHVFGKPAITTDTHVMRIAKRLGWTAATKPPAIEAELASLFAPEIWTNLCDTLIFHGRACCTARKPQCDECPVRDRCPAIGV